MIPTCRHALAAANGPARLWLCPRPAAPWSQPSRRFHAFPTSNLPGDKKTNTTAAAKTMTAKRIEDTNQDGAPSMPNELPTGIPGSKPRKKRATKAEMVLRNSLLLDEPPPPHRKRASKADPNPNKAETDPAGSDGVIEKKQRKKRATKAEMALRRGQETPPAQAEPNPVGSDGVIKEKPPRKRATKAEMALRRGEEPPILKKIKKPSEERRRRATKAEVALRRVFETTTDAEISKALLSLRELDDADYNNLRTLALLDEQDLPTTQKSRRTHLAPVTAITLVHKAAQIWTSPNLTLEDKEAQLTEMAKASQASHVWVETAKQLSRRSGTNTSRKPGARTDTRVQIYNEALCDDVISYLGPSLERHRGCDIVDMYPGGGLFSRKLNDFLQPRSHILMEPNEAVFKPLLEPLLSRPGTTLVPRSGMVWDHLNTVLSPEFLPHQTEKPRDPSSEPQRNDTLLVIANMAFHPKKAYLNFDSVAKLLMFQFIRSVSAATMFQKYGLVRMLVWLDPSDVDALLPHYLERRRRPAVEVELATEYMAEVCGPAEHLVAVRDANLAHRDPALDLLSAKMTLERMRSAGLEIPEHRWTSPVFKQARDMVASGEAFHPPGVVLPALDPKIEEEISALKDRSARTQPREQARMINLTNRRREHHKIWTFCHEILNERLSILQDVKALSKKRAAGRVSADKLSELERQLEERKRAWNAKLDAMPHKPREFTRRMLEEGRTFSQDPPVLMRDRRPYEPFVVQADEFFPQVPLSLVDIQPKAMYPLLRQLGKQSNRAGDIFEILLKTLHITRGTGLSQVVKFVAHGASDGMKLREIASLYDPARAGSAIGGHDEVSPRSMTQEQYTDLLEAWMAWPMRPSYIELATMSRERDVAENE